MDDPMYVLRISRASEQWEAGHWDISQACVCTSRLIKNKEDFLNQHAIEKFRQKKRETRSMKCFLDRAVLRFFRLNS